MTSFFNKIKHNHYSAIFNNYNNILIISIVFFVIPYAILTNLSFFRSFSFYGFFYFSSLLLALFAIPFISKYTVKKTKADSSLTFHFLFGIEIPAFFICIFRLFLFTESRVFNNFFTLTLVLLICSYLYKFFANKINIPEIFISILNSFLLIVSFPIIFGVLVYILPSLTSFRIKDLSLVFDIWDAINNIKIIPIMVFFGFFASLFLFFILNMILFVALPYTYIKDWLNTFKTNSNKQVSIVTTILSVAIWSVFFILIANDSNLNFSEILKLRIGASFFVIFHILALLQ
ncbi:MAG: hypothetical protein AB7U85_06085 [Alphaproteobacteria bacterium]